MSEKTNKKETFVHQDTVQFNDGRMGLGFMTTGDRLTFDGSHKHADPNDGTSTVLVKTKGGTRYALGRGVMVQLPELDQATGKFGESGIPVKAIAIDKLPAGLTDITIGETWDTLGSEDPVTMVLLDYKNTSQNPNYNQLDMPNPFDSAKEHLVRVSGKMQQSQ